MIFRFGNFSEWVMLNLFQFIKTVMTGAYAQVSSKGISNKRGESFRWETICNADKIIVKEHHIQCLPEDLNLSNLCVS